MEISQNFVAFSEYMNFKYVFTNHVNEYASAWNFRICRIHFCMSIFDIREMSKWSKAKFFPTYIVLVINTYKYISSWRLFSLNHLSYFYLYFQNDFGHVQNVLNRTKNNQETRFSRQITN